MEGAQMPRSLGLSASAATLSPFSPPASPSKTITPLGKERRGTARNPSTILGELPASPATMRASASLPSLFKEANGSGGGNSPPKEIYTRKWTTEHKRHLHQKREREWLRRKGKHGCIDFSDAERTELHRYFDALAVNNRISLERLEDMLISLGLASTQHEVREIVKKIDVDGNASLDFDEYLEIFRSRQDSEIFQVFKAMMEGKLGDRNLNFQTVISSYRRQLFIEATGAQGMRPVRLPSDNVALDTGTRILGNFATLQRNRYQSAASQADEGGVPADKELLPFEVSGSIPPGGLAMVWRDIADKCKFVPSRPGSADRSTRALGVPPSPRTVINNIVKVSKRQKRPGHFGNTIVIQAPALESPSEASSPMAGRRSIGRLPGSPKAGAVRRLE